MLRVILEVTVFVFAFSSFLVLLLLHLAYISSATDPNSNCVIAAMKQCSTPVWLSQFDGNTSTVQAGSNLLYSSNSIDDTVLQFDVLQIRIKYSPIPESSVFSIFPDYHLGSRLEYLYAMDRGLLMMSKTSLSARNLTILQLNLNTNDSCFGQSQRSMLTRLFLGFDIAVTNWAIAAFDGKGFLFNTQSSELYNLNFASDFMSKKGISMLDQAKHSRTKSPKATRRRKFLPSQTINEKIKGFLLSRSSFQAVLRQALRLLDSLSLLVLQWLPQSLLEETGTESVCEERGLWPGDGGGDGECLEGLQQMRRLAQQALQYLAFRLGVVFSTVFLFFIMTTLVSYVLRETQERMLR